MKRGSGGLLVFFKKELKRELVKISSRNPDMIWVKQEKSFLTLTMIYIYMLCAYIPQNNSEIHQKGDIFNNINIEISSFTHRGEIIVIGDLNSRLSNITET